MPINLHLIYDYNNAGKKLIICINTIFFPKLILATSFNILKKLSKTIFEIIVITETNSPTYDWTKSRRS